MVASEAVVGSVEALKKRAKTAPPKDFSRSRVQDWVKVPFSTQNYDDLTVAVYL